MSLTVSQLLQTNDYVSTWAKVRGFSLKPLREQISPKQLNVSAITQIGLAAMMQLSSVPNFILDPQYALYATFGGIGLGVCAGIAIGLYNSSDYMENWKNWAVSDAAFTIPTRIGLGFIKATYTTLSATSFLFTKHPAVTIITVLPSTFATGYQISGGFVHLVRKCRNTPRPLDDEFIELAKGPPERVVSPEW